jgi:amidase
MRVGEYVECDGTGLAELIAAGQVSAAEVRDAALEALDQVAELNAVVHGPYEDAVAGDGPFAGVPFAAKDTLMEAGRPCEFGSRLLQGFIAPVDATLAERFRGAGLLSLARTNTPELAFNFDTAPVANGATRNPWAVDRSPGGSSGGAAALVASRALPIAHANDGGGSIRIPAAWCGLVGLKPSRGRVPAGPFMGEPSGGIAHELAVTRSVRDAARLLDAVNGPAPGDRYYVAAPERPFADAVGSDPGRLRVAVHTESFFGRPTDPQIAAAVEAVARQLEDLGHTVEPACGPIDVDGMARTNLTIWSWFLAGIAAPLGARMGRRPGPDTLEAASLACIEHAHTLTALDVAKAYAVQNATGRAWGAFLDEYDLFLCPTTATAQTPSGTPAQDDPRFTTAESWMDELFSYIPFTPLANATGQPSLSLPLGTASDGLPIGVMLTAQTLREDVLLAVAAQLEAALPWADRRPAVCAG